LLCFNTHRKIKVYSYLSKYFRDYFNLWNFRKEYTIKLPPNIFQFISKGKFINELKSINEI